MPWKWPSGRSCPAANPGNEPLRRRRIAITAIRPTGLAAGGAASEGAPASALAELSGAAGKGARRVSALAEFGSASGDRGLAVRGLVLVDDALARGLVQVGARGAHGLGRPGHVARVRGLTELAHRGLQR